MTPANKCPVDHTTMQWLWEHNKGIQDQLREVVEPLSEQVSAAVEKSANVWDAVSYETTSTRVQHGIPFGEPYVMLPPRLFGGLAEVTIDEPVIPRDEAQINALVSSYKQRWERQNPGEDMQDAPSHYAWSAEGNDPAEKLPSVLEDLGSRGVRIDPVKWEQYKQVGREQIRSGRYDLEIMSMRRARSIMSMRSCAIYADLADNHAVGSFNDFMAMETAALDEGGYGDGLVPVGYVFMPVGAYGSEFSEKLLRTTAYMINTTSYTVRPLARRLAITHEDVLRKHTTRGEDNRPLDAAVMMMTQEGARSIMEATTLLTANKVEGYDNPEALFEAIVEQGILEHFTRSLPLGLLGPLAFSGKYFPGILRNKGDGRLELNPDAMAPIKQAKKDAAAFELGAWMTYWSLPEAERKEANPPAATHLICPAAMPHGALSRMSNAMLSAFKAFQFDPSGKAFHKQAMWSK